MNQSNSIEFRNSHTHMQSIEFEKIPIGKGKLFTNAVCKNGYHNEKKTPLIHITHKITLKS